MASFEAVGPIIGHRSRWRWPAPAPRRFVRGIDAGAGGTPVRMGLVHAACTLLLAAAAAGASAAPTSCEELRATVQSRIRANGVADATVIVEDATGPLRGKVVGSCELGTRRLVYLAQPVASAPPAAPSLPKKSTVITECDDGRVVTPGPCRR